MINRSLVVKLWLAIIILVFTVMFFLGVFLSQFFEDFYFSNKARDLQNNGMKVADMIVSSPDIIQLEEQLSTISNFVDAKVVVIDKMGLIQSYTTRGLSLHKGMKLEYPDVEKILNGEITANRGNYPGLNMTVITVGVPIKTGNDVIGAVFLLSPVEPITQTVRMVQSYILYGAVGTIILATILGFFVSKHITKPILDMNRVAMEMASGNFQEKVNIVSEDEIGLLGNTINYLSHELQKNIDALSTEKSQLENILTSMSDAVITVDTSGNILMMNPPAQKLLRLEEKTKINEIKISDLEAGFQKALDGKASVNYEAEIGNRNFKIGFTPLRNKKGDIRGVVAVLRDITQEKRLESLRREFVANVSHELRSPLSLLQGYVEALADGLAEDEEQRQKYLKIVLDETLRLKRLVTELLDLTQIETGNINMSFDKVYLNELIYIVTDRFRQFFEEQSKILEVSVPEESFAVLGNEDRLQQVLINLLDNAMKYTPEQGTVRVGVVPKGDKVEVYVEDSGCGIPQDQLEHVWERFYKVDKARTREERGGTGLGLAIVKTIIQAHGGEVAASSELGKGTKFSFILKLYSAEGGIKN